MNSAEREAVRQAISQKRREQLDVPVCPNGYSSEHGYGEGCKCSACTAAATELRRTRRRNQVARRQQELAGLRQLVAEAYAGWHNEGWPPHDWLVRAQDLGCVTGVEALPGDPE